MEEFIEIKPKQLNYSLSSLTQSISIQNLTLHFIQVKIISPNPTLFSINPNSQPCTNTNISIALNLNNQLNCQALIYNSKITILYYDIDDLEGSEELIDPTKSQWHKLSEKAFGQSHLSIQYDMPDNKYKTYKDKLVPPLENMQIFHLLSLDDQLMKLTVEINKSILDQFLQKFHKYDTYKVMGDRILFLGLKFEQQNELFIIQSDQLIFVASYKPNFSLMIQPKNSVEIMSPVSCFVGKRRNCQINDATYKSPHKHRSEVPNNKEDIQIERNEYISQQQQQSASLFEFKNQNRFQEEEDISDSNQLKEQIQDQPNIKQQISEQPNQQEILFDLQKHQIQTNDGEKQSQQSPKNHNIKELDIQKIKEQLKSTPQTRGRKAYDDSRASLMIRSNEGDNRRGSQRSLSIQLGKDSPIYQPRQSINVTNWDLKAKLEQKTFVGPPVVFTAKDKEIQNDEQAKDCLQGGINVNEVAQLKTYQQIQHIMIFRDGKYLITIGEKQDIKVWNLAIKGLVGQLKDLENKKDRRVIIIQEWRYMDPTADENYEFQLKDPQEQKNQLLYTPYETAYRFITGSEDQIFRIFNLTSMKLEQQFSCRLQFPTALTFLVDRGLFCIGGQPYKTIFGQTRKYRSIRFFCMNNLQEKPKYKIFCKHEDEYLNQVIYTENPPLSNEHHHNRLNNILCIQVHRKNNNGKQFMLSAKIYFVFIDRMNQCTVLMTLECDSLNIRGINHIKYLYKQGQFAIIESNDVVTNKNHQITENTQKVVLINLKQLQTQQGMQNGLECNLIQEQTSKLSIQILANPTLIVIPQTKQIVFQNLQGEDQIIQPLEVGDPRTQHNLVYMNILNNFIITVMDDTVQVISLQ